MKAWRHLPIVLFLVIASGCAAVHVQEKNLYPEATDGKAIVYFFRESKFAGSAVSYYIYLDDEKIGALANGTYFFKEFDPGTYTFLAKTEAADQVTLTVEADRTYYIKGEVDMGFFAGHPDLTIAHGQEAKSELPGLKYATISAN